MGKIVASEFVTLDGVFQDPGGTGEFVQRGWARKTPTGPEADKFKLEELFGTDALLLGRVTYAGFAQVWPAMPPDEAGYIQRMNSLPKYVVSTTLTKADWNNSHIIKGSVANEVSQLKTKFEKDILIFGSGALLRTLMQDTLVDEYRLMVWPVVLGSGKRLFEGGTSRALKLISAQPSGSGVVILTYSSVKQ